MRERDLFDIFCDYLCIGSLANGTSGEEDINEFFVENGKI